MDYNEMLFAYLVRQEIMKRIANETDGQQLTNTEMGTLLEEYLVETIESVRGVAKRIRGLPS